MKLSLETCVIRSWRLEDVDGLVRSANHRAVAAFLRDSFPHPYSYAEGQAWVDLCMAQQPEVDFVIEVEGEVAGGIGLEPQYDIYRQTAEIGYWLNPRFWGRGICTEAVIALTNWAFETLEYRRIYAGVFSNNPASMRVLEKAGYTREARLKQAIYKRGQVLDEVVYATWPPAP